MRSQQSKCRTQYYSPQPRLPELRYSLKHTKQHSQLVNIISHNPNIVNPNNQLQLSIKQATINPTPTSNSQSEKKCPNYQAFQKTTFFIKNNYYKHTQQRQSFIQQQLQKRSSIDTIQQIRSHRKIVFKNHSEILQSNFYDKIGASRTINQIVEYLMSQVHVFPHFKTNFDLFYFKMRMVTFLEFISGKPVFYNIEALREKHLYLNITNGQFNMFKCFLMEGFLKANQGEPEMIFEFASYIEQYRYVIVNKDQSFAQVYNQKASQFQLEDYDGITLLAFQTYGKIYKDTSLSAYFRDIELSQQAPKFAKILNQMMGWEQNIDNTMNFLRKSHEKYQLTNVHFTLFKQHLVASFREIGIKDKLIQIITQRMDGYRCCLLNQDSFIELVYRVNDGKKLFLKNYKNQFSKINVLVFFCLEEPISKKNYNAILQLRNFVRNHCQFLFYFFAYQQKPLLSYKDICFFHRNYKITEKDIRHFEENFMYVARQFNVNPIQLTDFSDVWLLLKQNILSEKSITKQIGCAQTINVNLLQLSIYGFQLIQRNVATKLQENSTYSFYFQNIDYQIKYHIKRIISFMFDNQQIFKSSDLKVIHQNLKITDQAFDIFLYIIKIELEDLGIDIKIIESVEKTCCYYKDSIVSQKDSTQTTNYILSQIKETRKNSKMFHELKI